MESVALVIDERIAVLDAHIARLELALYRRAMVKTRPVDAVPCERHLRGQQLSYADQSAAILRMTTAEQRAAVSTAFINDITRLKTTH